MRVAARNSLQEFGCFVFAAFGGHYHFRHHYLHHWPSNPVDNCIHSRLFSGQNGYSRGIQSRRRHGCHSFWTYRLCHHAFRSRLFLGCPHWVSCLHLGAHNRIHRLGRRIQGKFRHKLARRTCHRYLSHTCFRSVESVVWHFAGSHDSRAILP